MKLGDVPPPLQASEWLNARAPIALADLRGRVVAVHVFQMLCPGCVSHALPQVQRLVETFDARELAVLGVHSVFEHHEAMTPLALRAFAHEYRLRYPIAVDAPAPEGGIPLTMRAWELHGTPSLLLLDREGRLRLSHFGAVEDLALGALIGQLLAPTAAA